MFLLIYLILTQIMIKIECAPEHSHINSINETNSSLKITSTPHNTTKKHSSNANVTLSLEQVSATITNETPNLDLEKGKNRTNALHTLDMIRNSVFSQENDISDDDSPSDWLDPDSESIKITKNPFSDLTLPKKTECKKCIDAIKSNPKIDKNQSNKKTSDKTLQTRSQYDYSTKSKKASNQETPKQKILMTLLRGMSSQEINYLGGNRISIDGYEYNINICKHRGNRYVCGYNKNIGQTKDPAEIQDIGNGCIMRNERIECGYKSNLGKAKLQLNDATQQKAIVASEKAYISTATPDTTPQMSVSSTDASETANRNGNTKRACYEHDDRIVCYDIPL